MKLFYKISNELNEAIIGQGIIPEILGEHEVELKQMWAEKVDCAVIPTSPKGFDLKGATFQECAMGFRKVFNGMTTHLMDCSDIAATEDGKVVITYEVDDVSKQGVRYDVPGFNRFEFNDEGKIVKMLQIFNPNLLMPQDGGVNQELLTEENALEEYQVTPPVAVQATSKAELLGFVGTGVMLGGVLVFSVMRKRTQEPSLMEDIE